MMRIKDFYEIIEQDKELEPSMLTTLESLVDKFPVFQAGLFIYLKCLYVIDSPKFISELTRLTPFIHDRQSLFYYLLKGLYSKFKVKENNGKQIKDRTSMLINAFFDTLGGDDSKIEELLSDMAIQNSSMASQDYFSFMNNEKNTNSQDQLFDTSKNEEFSRGEIKMKNQDLIDKFISDADEFTKISPDLSSVSYDNYIDEDTDEEPSIADRQDEDFFFTQTLVDIYIKQRKYDRAYEIIKRLNLNNSEKNIYFADQLCFLEKQIHISNNK